MRLSVIFLAVLAASALLTSMAAWGITYGTSYSKVSTMAADIITVSRDSMALFGTLISDLQQDNTQLVTTILEQQRQSALNSTEEMKADMTNTINTLINYTVNNTGTFQTQLGVVVDNFALLVGSVVADFKGVATSYSTQLRADLVTRVSGIFVTTTTQITSMMRRLQNLIDVGLISFSRSPTDPVGEEDCTVLGVLCNGAEEINATLVLASATGRLYRCSPFEGGVVSVISNASGMYNESYWRWLPYPASVPAASRLLIKQRCLSEPAIVQPVGVNCPLPAGCQCGADPRCTPWYRAQANSSAYSFASTVYESAGVSTLHISMPLVASSAAASAPVVAVLDSPSDLMYLDLYLTQLAAALTDPTSIVMLLNDTALTVLGTSTKQCTSNATAPGNIALPVRSGLRACDPGLRALSLWMATNRPAAYITQEFNGMLWDVLPVPTAASTYFFVVGTNKSLATRAVSASEAKANAQLAVLRTTLMTRMTAIAATNRANLAVLGTQNNKATQGIQDRFLAEVSALRNSSMAALDLSQANSNARVQSVTESQTALVAAQRTYYLDSMATTSGWTIGVVLGILLVVLLLSAMGTVHVTNTLTHIIGMMEDVAEMKVENLEVPQDSSVAEVARIQTAFQVLVRRLAEYKSYIPAGVFEKLEPDTVKEDDRTEVCAASELGTTSECSPGGQLSRSPQDGRKPNHHHFIPNASGEVSVVSKRSSVASGAVSTVTTTPTRRAVKRSVAVLSINVRGFMDVLLTISDGLAKNILNEYLTHVHEAITVGRGNIDCILGDQIFVTFNAHIPCSDPAGAATAAALELQSQLLPRMDDRMRFQIGLSFGPVFASSVGYSKFKSMVTIGSPMKVASLLCHMDRFENGVILVDSSLEERVKYSYSLRPVELVHMPQLKTFARGLPTSQRIYKLLNKKQLRENEWIYQVEDEASAADWNHTFDELVAAKSLQHGQSFLKQYLAGCPHDEVALRLRDRLALWVPGQGIPV